MVTRDKQWWTFEVLGPSMIYNRFNREISCHCITASPHHRVTMLVSHLPCPLPPNQSVIWLALYHCITTSPHHCVTASLRHCVSQSFALPPATKPVSHLICPLPPHHPVTTSLHHHVTASLCHCVSQSFALPPATKPVSHLPCPLPPNQSVIWFALYHHVTASLHHCITVSPRHCITASLHQIFPTTWVWIWLVNANQHSSDWLIVPTTANQITGIEKPNYHKTLIFSPPPLWNGHMKPE